MLRKNLVLGIASRSESTDRTSSASGWPTALAILTLVAAALAIHGWSLGDGVFLDDHWHRLQLRNHDWSWQGLLDAATIEPDRFIHTWWQDKTVSWHYIRPVAIFMAKLVYHSTGGSVKAWHAISLVAHVVNALLVYMIACRLTQRRWWALVAGLLFLVYSHNVYAVAWLAAQNIIIQTAFSLLALLCYIRASGLQIGPQAAIRADLRSAGQQDYRGDTHERLPLSVPWFAATLVFWLLAVLSRENAVVLPVVLGMFDLAYGGRRHLRARLPGLLFLLCLAGAFWLWRVVFFNHPMPDFYFQRPHGEWGRYALWAIAKLMHFLTAVIWLSPMSIGPSGRFNPFSETPGDCFFMAAIIAILGVYYYFATRRVPGWWIWPAWMLLALLPVIPILATPHSAYLPSVGFAIAMVLAPGLRDRVDTGACGRLSSGVALWFLIATTIYMPIYRPMWYSFLAAERSTIQRVIQEPPPSTARHLFFLNLPFTNIYAGLHLASLWDEHGGPRAGEPIRDFLGTAPPSFSIEQLKRRPQPDFRTHVLTYAPEVMYLDSPCTLEQIDDKRFVLSIENRAYFSGALGRYCIEGMRRGGRFQPGERIETADFAVTILEADDRGVWKMEFAFPQELASENYAFYLCTTDHAATRIRFPSGASTNRLDSAVPDGEGIRTATAALAAGNAEAALPLLDALAGEDVELAAQARPAIDRWVRPVVRAWAAPCQQAFDQQHPTADDWRLMAEWWQRYINNDAFVAVHRDAEHYADLNWTRGRLLRTRAIAARIIRSDVYLTGDPFPGPQAP